MSFIPSSIEILRARAAMELVDIHNNGKGGMDPRWSFS
jgi:hypothetical protein